MSNWGIAPHDYSSAAVRGLVGRFFKRVENELSNTFAFKIGTPIPSNQPTETYRWLGHPQQLRRWLGGRLLRGLPIRSYSLANLIFEDTLSVDVEDWRYHKLDGQLQIRFDELSHRAAMHWDKLSTDALQANGTAWDGLSYFSASHDMGGGTAVQTNDLSVTEIPGANIASLLAMTTDEAIAILLQVFPKFYEFIDNAGEPYNDGMRSMRVMCAPRHVGAFLGAIRLLLFNSGASNPLQAVMGGQSYGLAQGGGWDIDVIPNSRLVGAPNVVYFFRVDTPMKPLILQAVFKGAAQRAPDGTFDLSSDLEMAFIGEGSENAFLRNQYLFGVKAVRNVGYGEWAHAIRLTLS